MLNAASVHVFEIDDVSLALEEVHRQLDEKLVLCKNTVGILHCGADFIESGVVSSLCESLSFPVVGTTSMAEATNQGLGSLMLSLLVLTGDDVVFVPVHTNGHADDFSGSIERSFAEASRPEEMPLKLVLNFPSLLDKYSGDDYIGAFEKTCGNVPIFGSFSIEEEITTYTRNATICNGECFAEEMVYLLVYGNCEPRFFVAPMVCDTEILDHCVITKADRHSLQEINETPAVDFFERFGMAKDGQLREGVNYLPFLLSMPGEDGSRKVPFARGLIDAAEDGSILCRGTMYEQAILSIGSNTPANILAAAEELNIFLQNEQDVHAVLAYSCVMRRIGLLQKPELEMEAVQGVLQDDIPFLMAYSGGEFCPSETQGHAPENRFHNFSFIACVL